MNRFTLLLLALNSTLLFGQSKKVKLGSSVNSSYYEGSPLITADGKRLYFYRTGHPENSHIHLNSRAENVWYCDMKKSGSKAKNIGSPINHTRNSAVAGISADGNIIFLYNSYDVKHGFKGLSKSVKKPTGWTKPQEIPIEDFYIDGRLIWMFVSPNENVLLMSVKRKDTKGGDDI